MKHLIDKDALVAEIEKLNPPFYPTLAEKMSYQDALRDCIDIIYALKEKEVDLKEEIDKFWKPRFSLGWDDKPLLSVSYKGFESIAKHFFELGLKVQKGE